MILRESPTQSPWAGQSLTEFFDAPSKEFLGWSTQSLHSRQLVYLDSFYYLARKEVICVRQILLSPSDPMYSLADQKVLPSDGSTTIVL